MAQAHGAQARTTIDDAEVERFSRLAAEWWNPAGKFKPLHKFNPVRLGYIREKLCERFGRDPKALRPFEGLRILDIGCGGGLIAEPLARLGAEVVGADASATNIEVARLHAEQSGVPVDYRAETAEALHAAGERFDVVLALEVVEHVADVDLFLGSAAGMVKPGGLILVATINRRLADFAGLDPRHGEPLQGQRYAVGQEFKAHTDYFEPNGQDFARYCAVSGQRTWTVMIYLNDVEAGGATRFKAIDKIVQPETGKLLAWNNLRADGSVNPSTLHHAMKVRAGLKYVITQWFRERPWGW